MARLINLLPIACLALAACGGESVVTGNADATVNPPGAAPVDPKVAAEMEKLKKIADEHRASVRIANLRDAAAGDAAEGPARGARVSLSFSSFMPTPGPAAADGETTQAH